MTTRWRIVPATTQRLHQAAALHALCFPGDAWDVNDFAGILQMAGTTGRFVLDGTDGSDDALGFLFDTLLVGAGEIITLGVVPPCRRRGAARALLADLFERTRTACVTSLTLEVADDNPAALALYRSLGFEQVGVRPRYYRRVDGLETDALLLRRTMLP